MTNKELQDQLKQYPDDLPVCVIDNEITDLIDYVERRKGTPFENAKEEYFEDALVLF